MVGAISWLSDIRRFKTNHEHHHHGRWMSKHEKLETLGILAFDTAKSMSRLVSLYKSLSDNEVQRLRKEVIKTKGVGYLITRDEKVLLTLACAERLEDLDRAASTVARLGHKCVDYGLVRFGLVYKDLRRGYVDMEKLYNYGSKEMEKAVDKMEKFTSLTAELYVGLEELAELEASERKLIEWKKNNRNADTNYDLFDQKLHNQRKHVRHLKEVSLWSKSHDKIVGLMAKMVCGLYARICNIFAPFVCTIPHRNGQHCKSSYIKMIHQRFFSDSAQQTTMSGPLHGSSPKIALVRFLSRDSNIFVTQDVELKLELGQQTNNLSKHRNKVFHAAPQSTVGGSGLSNRYANIILLAKRYLNSDILIGDQERENLYNILPCSLRKYVRSKLRAAWRESEDETYSCHALAEGWREALNGMLEWLSPIAQDTLTWQAERNLEKQRFDAKPTVLLIQTLHYADLEKTEAAITEVLVGLSCVYWYDDRKLSCEDMY